MPARPTPNLFSNARRVTDWARFLVSSSNCWFIVFLSGARVSLLTTANIAGAEREAASVTVAAVAAGGFGVTMDNDVGAHGSLWQASVPSLGLIRQSEGCQRNSGEANTEFLQRRAARDGLGHTFGEFV